MPGTSVVPHFNLWLQRDERVVLSPWRVRLLEAIDETRSIKAAASGNCRAGLSSGASWRARHAVGAHAFCSAARVDPINLLEHAMPLQHLAAATVKREPADFS